MVTVVAMVASKGILALRVRLNLTNVELKWCKWSG